jgi:purine-binding chemotaxis protein CheW
MSGSIAGIPSPGEGQSSLTNAACSEITSANADAAAAPAEFINFAVGDDQYGVDIMSVREIREWSNVTHLPRQQEYVRGVLNLRGVVVPVIDLRCRFGQGLTDCTPTHIIIIVQLEGRQMGLLADQVLDIVSFDQSEVQLVPSVARSQRARFLSGLVTVEGTMIALIDLVHLLSEDSDDGSLATRPFDA